MDGENEADKGVPAGISVHLYPGHQSLSIILHPGLAISMHTASIQGGT